MQIVIDIPEDVYTRLFDNGIQDNEIAVDDVCEMARAIRNGTPLPKGHGRLIDADEVVKEICIECKVNSIYELPDELRPFIKKYLNEAPTILKPTIEYMIKNYAFSESEG